MLYTILKPIAWFVFKIIFRVRFVGAENIPETGGCILTCNHMSLPDPVFLAIGMKRHLCFMAKAEIFSIKICSWFFRSLGAYPVRRGARDMAAIRTSTEILNKGKMMGIFPQGHRYKGEKLTRFKPGFALIAAHAGVPVVPAYIKTKNQRLRPFRKVSVIYGKPVTAAELGYTDGSSENLQQMAAALYEITEELADRI